MSVYTVKEASKKKDVPDAKFGPAQVIALTLSDGNGDKQAEWFTRATTPLPEPGSKLEGEVTEGSYGLSFKKASQGFGGGGRSPRDSGRIERQHSQEMALRYAAYTTSVSAKDLGVDGIKLVDLEQIKLWTDYFVADLDNSKEGGGGGGGQPAGAFPEAPGGSTESVQSAAPSTIAMSMKQKDFMDSLLKQADVDSETRSVVMAWATEVLTGGREGSASVAIDGLHHDTNETIRRLTVAAKNWAKNHSDLPPPDETDLPPLEDEIGPAEDDIPF